MSTKRKRWVRLRDPAGQFYDRTLQFHILGGERKELPVDVPHGGQTAEALQYGRLVFCDPPPGMEEEEPESTEPEEPPAEAAPAPPAEDPEELIEQRAEELADKHTVPVLTQMAADLGIGFEKKRPRQMEIARAIARAEQAERDRE